MLARPWADQTACPQQEGREAGWSLKLGAPLPQDQHPQPGAAERLPPRSPVWKCPQHLASFVRGRLCQGPTQRHQVGVPWEFPGRHSHPSPSRTRPASAEVLSGHTPADLRGGQGREFPCEHKRPSDEAIPEPAPASQGQEERRVRRFHSKKDGAPAGPSLLLGPGLHPGHPDPGALSLGRGLPLPIWPWNYPVSPPRPTPSDPMLWAESSSRAVSVCDNRLSTSSPRGPVPAPLLLMFQGDNQNRGPHPMKVGGWDARRPHLPTSEQPVSTRNQPDLRLESPPTRLPCGKKLGIARHFTCSESGPWLKRHLHSDGCPLLAGSLDSAPASALFG